VLSWFGIGSLYLSLIVIFQLALDTINVAHKDQLMWVFSMWYTYLVVIQVCGARHLADSFTHPSPHNPVSTHAARTAD
jgi:hypothetical protein